MRTKGHEFLTSVDLSVGSGAAAQDLDSSVVVGSRLKAIPIAPSAMGGRLALFAKEFSQHKVHRLKFYYEPSVPTTTPGAISMYFAPDVGAPQQSTGTLELRYASTHSAFCQTNVWSECVLDVKPEDAYARYFDEHSGNFMLTIQGQFFVLAASDLEAPVGQGPNFTFGSIYVEYDVEFFAPEIDRDILFSEDATMVVKHVNTSGLPVDYPENEPFVFTDQPPGDGGFGFEWSKAPEGWTVDASNEFVFAATVTALDTFETVQLYHGEHSFELTQGQTFYVRFKATEEAPPRAVVAGCYASLTDAARPAEGEISGDQTEMGNVYVEAATAEPNSQARIILTGRCWQV